MLRVAEKGALNGNAPRTAPEGNAPRTAPGGTDLFPRTPLCPARMAGICLLVAGALGFLLSCATVPLRPSSEWLGVLPADSTLYFSLSVPGSAELIKKSLKDAGPGFQDVSALIDRSKRLVGSVTLTPGSPARFSALALGDYPSGVIGMRLGGNKEWKKASSKAGSWWEWSKAGLQMAIPNNGILLASNGGVERMLGLWSAPPALAVPPDVADDMRTGDLVMYMPQLPGGIAQSAARNSVRIPVQEVWLKALRTKDGFDVSGTANTGTERDAKVFTLALRLGIVAWMRTANLPNVSVRLKAISVAASGVQVKLAGFQLPDAELVPLFLSLVKGLSPSGAAPAPTAEAPAANQGSAK